VCDAMSAQVRPARLSCRIMTLENRVGLPSRIK